SRIGDGWLIDLPQLRELEGHIDDDELRERWRAGKLANKRRLAGVVEQITGVELLPSTMLLDVQVKRMHEYKRQLLNAQRLTDSPLQLRDDPTLDVVPRAVLFGGKAAPTYWFAKLTIKLINCIAEATN